MPRVSKFTDTQFEEIYISDISDEDKAEKLGISKAYMNNKAKKLGIKKARIPAKPVIEDYPVIVTETGTYTRSYITYSKDAEVKVEELREVCECNDTNYVTKKLKVKKMTEAEIEKEHFLVSKLKRNFSEVN